MDRAGIRKTKRGQDTSAGNLKRELEEIRGMQESEAINGIVMITVGCSPYLTVICC